MAVTAIDILATIRDNATDDYIARVPEATRDNLNQIGTAISASQNIMNEFVSALINKIALSSIRSRMFTNPLSRLKTAVGKPLGSTIEELFINPAIGQEYSTDQTLLLKTSKPDGKACYFGLNRKNTYPVTVNRNQLEQAFSNEQGFMRFYNGIVNSLYSGDQIDEFNICKGLLATNVDNNNILRVECDIKEPKELSKLIANSGDYFTFPTTVYNGYNYVNASKITAGETKVTTFCPSENQVLIIRADVLNEINYEVLANMFHMELAQIKQMIIKVDQFPNEVDVSGNVFDTYAILCDKEAIQMIDDVFATDNQYIGSSREWNIWLHHWQWIYLSMFANCVAFGKSTLQYNLLLSQTDPLTFPSQIVGYDNTLLTHDITLTNNGAHQVDNVNVTLSGTNANDFTLVGFTNTTLLPTQVEHITLTPNEDLTAGTYNAVLTISGDNITDIVVNVSFTVTA